MKIRCKNCYRVLNKNEEFCTRCGEHSKEMMEAMETGNYDLNESSLLKFNVLLFLFIGFFGTGILMVIFGLIQNDIYGNYDIQVCHGYSLFATSIVLLISILILNRKALHKMFFSNNILQMLQMFVIAMLFGILSLLLSISFDFTRIIPNYMISYLLSEDCQFFSNGKLNIFILIVGMLIVPLIEEIIIRHNLLTYLDEHTMLGDFSLVMISTISGTLLSFMWIMSSEMLILSFVGNLIYSLIFLHTDRTIGVNLISRYLIIIAYFVILV